MGYRGQMTIHGTVAPGYERVREAFEANFRQRGEVGAALCVHVRGEVVVDLWGGVADAETGRPCEDFGDGGRVALREGIGPAPAWEYYPTSAPLVIRDVVVIGALVADSLRIDAPSGVVRAFDLRSGELRWILGTHDNWRKPWTRYLLKPRGELAWPFHQHSPQLTRSGNVLLFDNGNGRASPPAAR